MKIIKSNSFLVEEKNPLKKVELAGRTCYKSESNITDESAVQFYHKMKNSKHYAMLEHGTVTYEIETEDHVFLPVELVSLPYVVWSQKEENLYYVTLSLSHIEQYRVGNYDNFINNLMDHGAMSDSDTTHEILSAMCILFDNNYLHPSSLTTNVHEIEYYGTIKLLNDVTEIKDFNHEDWLTHKSITFKFICDRGVSHELVRHRCSVAQESTRYCNYSKDKHGNEITFIAPADYENWSVEAKTAFEASCLVAEKSYMQLIALGYKAQQGRAALNNALKTEVILTMFANRWHHFFNLRSIGTTGAPHPDMKVVADIAYAQFQDMESEFIVYENSDNEGEN